ncbi:uncharacterized protein LOC122048435 [Zingiber officinale]|uniref:uncharacterized protein LOC122048435 n=1 Tax=Zingiber officinale TaxID=94328 RepID=UPI001C4AD243|nr:uncharacterized protein LOC122048435 [Zingiber officinale]
MPMPSLEAVRASDSSPLSSLLVVAALRAFNRGKSWLEEEKGLGRTLSPFLQGSMGGKRKFCGTTMVDIIVKRVIRSSRDLGQSSMPGQQSLHEEGRQTQPQTQLEVQPQPPPPPQPQPPPPPRPQPQ